MSKCSIRYGITYSTSRSSTCEATSILDEFRFTAAWVRFILSGIQTTSYVGFAGVPEGCHFLRSMWFHPNNPRLPWLPKVYDQGIGAWVGERAAVRCRICHFSRGDVHPYYHIIHVTAVEEKYLRYILQCIVNKSQSIEGTRRQSSRHGHRSSLDLSKPSCLHRLSPWPAAGSTRWPSHGAVKCLVSAAVSKMLARKRRHLFSASRAQ